MHQKLLMNGFIVDRESMRLILKELNLLGVKQRAWRSLTRRTCISTGPKHTWHIDVYDKLKPFEFAVHDSVEGYSRKILWLGSINFDQTAKAYYFVDCFVDLQTVILQFNDFIVLQDFPIIWKNLPEHLKLQHHIKIWRKIAKYEIYPRSKRYVYQNLKSSFKSTIVQASNWPLYWLFFKKSVKIFRCPFSVTVYMPYVIIFFFTISSLQQSSELTTTIGKCRRNCRPTFN